MDGSFRITELSARTSCAFLSIGKNSVTATTLAEFCHPNSNIYYHTSHSNT